MYNLAVFYFFFRFIDLLTVSFKLNYPLWCSFLIEEMNQKKAIPFGMAYPNFIV